MHRYDVPPFFLDVPTFFFLFSYFVAKKKKMPTSIIYSSPNDFWIQDGAIRFELNALSDPDKIAVSLASGAVIMAWKQGVIDYNAGLNYRTWVLSAAPTHFNRQEKVYVYVRLSKVADTAQFLLYSIRCAYSVFGRRRDHQPLLV